MEEAYGGSWVIVTANERRKGCDKRLMLSTVYFLQGEEGLRERERKTHVSEGRHGFSFLFSLSRPLSPVDSLMTHRWLADEKKVKPPVMSHEGSDSRRVDAWGIDRLSLGNTSRLERMSLCQWHRNRSIVSVSHRLVDGSKTGWQCSPEHLSFS